MAKGKCLVSTLRSQNQAFLSRLSCFPCFSGRNHQFYYPNLQFEDKEVATLDDRTIDLCVFIRNPLSQ